MAGVKRRDAARATKASTGRAAATDILDAAQALITQALRFDEPTDVVLGRQVGADRRWGSRDRAVLGDVVFGVVRHASSARHVVNSVPGGPPPLERRLALLAWPASAFDGLKLDDATRAWATEARGFDRAQLPASAREDMPAWLVAALREAIERLPRTAAWPDVQDEVLAMRQALEQGAALDLRVNTMRAKRDAVQSALRSAGVECEPTAHSPWGLRVQGKPALSKLEPFEQGHVEIQDEGSQLLALLVDAKRGESVADFCAGAGGKTLALGAAMRGSGHLYAMDISASRLAALPARVTRAGLTNVHTRVIDSPTALDRLAGKLDRVLVDAPCTGLGTLRRSPDAKWRFQPDQLSTMIDRQLDILERAARGVRPGGRLVYATCSFLQQENEDVVAAFLARHVDFTPVDVDALLRDLRVRDVSALVAPASYIREDEAMPYVALRLWPHRSGTDGFFAAVMTRHP
jgi:16S rRNA (cytosine967-C5)-methyltransferase